MLITAVLPRCVKNPTPFILAIVVPICKGGNVEKVVTKMDNMTRAQIKAISGEGAMHINIG